MDEESETRKVPDDFPYDISEVKLTYSYQKDAVTIDVDSKKVRLALSQRYKELQREEGMGHKEYFSLVFSQLERVLAGHPVVHVPKKKYNFLSPDPDPMHPYICIEKSVSSIEVMKALEISLNLVCKRCTKRIPLVVGTKDAPVDCTNVVPCPKCKAPVKIETQLHTISQANRSALAKIVCRGADPFVVGSLLACACSSCGDVLEMAPPSERKCGSCASVLRVAATYSIKHDLVVPEEMPRDKPRDKSKAAAKYEGDGTCKHYRHSRRIFIFPCCGGRYPCDICHDESEDHKGALAARMECGICHAEGSVGTECPRCREPLTKVGGKRFWEGEKGNRNKATLSKKDIHKYK